LSGSSLAAETVETTAAVKVDTDLAAVMAAPDIE
jgi:hypothetical protein